VQCALEDASIAQELLTVQLDGHSLDDALHLITTLTDLQYERVGDRILLTAKKTR